MSVCLNEGDFGHYVRSSNPHPGGRVPGIVVFFPVRDPRWSPRRLRPSSDRDVCPRRLSVCPTLRTETGTGRITETEPMNG